MIKYFFGRRDQFAWARVAMGVILGWTCLAVGIGFAAETRRDDYGVWHITGTAEDGLKEIFHAMGRAVAEDRLWQLELFRRQARGELAELFGSDQLEADIFTRTIGYSDEELDEGFDGLSYNARQMIEGYIDGINQTIKAVSQDPDRLPFEFKALSVQLGRPVLPIAWSERDVLAWMALVLRRFDGEAFETTQLDNLALLYHLDQFNAQKSWDMFQDLRWINDKDAQTYIVPPSDRGAALLSASKAFKGGIGKSAMTCAAISSKMQRISKGLDDINALVKMGSYAWVVSGKHTRSGNPILYSGPQMGFSAPAIVFEGSLRGAGLNVSGMCIAGMPLIIIGRTPHLAWAMQTGQAHTTDYYFETPDNVTKHRTETFKVAGEADKTLTVYRTRSANDPVISPLPLNLADYQMEVDGPIVVWRYANRDNEFRGCESFLKWTRATNMDQFEAGVELLGSSQHMCYADRKGNIAYWMAGRSPVRTQGEWRLPQGALPSLPMGQWVPEQWLAMPADRNPARGYYAGWNNKAAADYDSGFNSLFNTFGPFHRAHTVIDYLDRRLARPHCKLSFKALRSLALNIATTDSMALGGNPWKSVAPYFTHAVRKVPRKPENRRQHRKRIKALRLLKRWNGHFVPGRRTDWASHPDRADAWMLMDAWTHEVLRLTFGDELGPHYETPEPNPMDAKAWSTYERRVLINVLLHGLNKSGAIQNAYDWFTNADAQAPQTANAIIVAALDSALAQLGHRPWGIAGRGTIDYVHPLLQAIDGHGVVWQSPFTNRSTYAQIVEMGPAGPVRIESMFPLGPSGKILMSSDGSPVFDPNFFSMTEVYDRFLHRPFPLFDR